MCSLQNVFSIEYVLYRMCSLQTGGEFVGIGIVAVAELLREEYAPSIGFSLGFSVGLRA